MDFEIAGKSQLKVKIYGQDYVLAKPSVKLIFDMQKELKAAGDEGAVGVMSDFLSKCGLDKEVVESMELDHFTALIEFITKAPKKS